MTQFFGKPRGKRCDVCGADNLAWARKADYSGWVLYDRETGRLHVCE